ncbi:MAG: hypothetical protein AAFW84_16310 [Cyanobacteria bacterium J06635_15]
MLLGRRKFTRNFLLGSASFATTSSFFFPRPVEAYSLEFNLSQVTSGNVFDNILSYTDIRSLGETLPSVDQIIEATVQRTEDEFIRREFIQGRTPFAETDLGFDLGVLWGRQKQEILGPNAGFATAQKVEGEPIRTTFSGSTTVGLYGAVQVLADQRLSPSDISRVIIPTRVQFEDWGTWEGDASPQGTTSQSSVTNYRTRRGEVTRYYRLEEPGPGGFGIINIVIESELEPRRDVSIRIVFA